MLCIKELGYFGYILLSVSLRPSFLSLYVYVLKIFNILKKKKNTNQLHVNYIYIYIYKYIMIYNSIFLSGLLVIYYIYNCGRSRIEDGYEELPYNCGHAAVHRPEERKR